MKIINLVPTHFDGHTDPYKWIEESRFFKGTWEQMAKKFSHEIIFIEFIDFNGKLSVNGVNYWFKNLSKRALRFPFISYLNIVLAKPDIVIVHGLLYPHQVMFLRFCLNSKVKIIVQHHAEKPSLNRIKRILQKWADYMIDCYFFTSKGLSESWILSGIIKNTQKIKEVMEVSSVFDVLDKDLAKAFTKIDTPNSYLWVGRLNENKNPMLVLEAFSSFVKERQDVKLFMIFQSEELLPQLEQMLTNDCNLARHVSLVGKCDHQALIYWYNSVDFIVSSSFYEAAGVSVCEAMSCGCIPILSDIPAFRFVTDSSCGLLYQVGDINALLSALKKSIVMDKEKAQKETLLQYQTKLSFEAIADKIDAIVSSL